MLHGLCLRVSWICLLWFSSGACFPASKGGYKYPYASKKGSSGGAAAHSPTGDWLPFSLGASSGATPSYHPGTSNFAAPASYNTVPAASGFGHEHAGYAAAPATSDSEDAVNYAEAPSTFTYDSSAPGSPSSSASLPWPGQPALGFQASFYNPSSWQPARPFPDMNVWNSELKVPQSGSETSPEVPSSYIIQSSNGYQRAREIESHMSYVPEYPEPPAIPYQAAKAPQKAPAKTAPKGGNKEA